MKRLLTSTDTSHRLLSALAAVTIGFCIWSPATATAQAPKSEVAVQLSAKKIVTTADGKEKLAGAEQAKPGDVIEYRAVYRNQSKRAVANLLATVPVPAGLEFLTGSTKPEQVQVSADGQTFAAVPLRQKGVDADKDGQDDLLPAGAYRAVRWSIPSLPAGESVTVSVRARVVNTAALLSQKNP